MARQASIGDVAAAVPRQADYASALFGQFSTNIGDLGDGVPLLDLGPSTPGNVMYWVRAGHPMSALDVMAHDDLEEVRLNYPDASFGGILCWTSLSHLSTAQARALMQEIGRVLRPDGWLFAVFDGDGRKPPAAQRYRILDADNLAFEPLAGREPPRAVLTREVETLLQPFREVRIMVMRHGSREALGRRP